MKASSEFEPQGCGTFLTRTSGGAWAAKGGHASKQPAKMFTDALRYTEGHKVPNMVTKIDKEV